MLLFYLCVIACFTVDRLGLDLSLWNAVLISVVQRVVDSNPALAATQGPWASPSLTVGTVSVADLKKR